MKEFERCVSGRATAPRVDAERPELLLHPADPDPEDQSPSGQLLDRRNPLRSQQRGTVRDDQHACGQGHALGNPGEKRRELPAAQGSARPILPNPPGASARRTGHPETALCSPPPLCESSHPLTEGKPISCSMLREKQLSFMSVTYSTARVTRDRIPDYPFTTLARTSRACAWPPSEARGRRKAMDETRAPVSCFTGCTMSLGIVCPWPRWSRPVSWKRAMRIASFRYRRWFWSRLEPPWLGAIRLTSGSVLEMRFRS